ncbi:MAG: AraC family transcriptional regulator [Bacteroidales bacterium]|jgi:AraC-like DNA-binding protein
MEHWSLADIFTIITAFQLTLLSAVILTSRRPGRLSQHLLAAFLLANVFLLLQFELISQFKPVKLGVTPFYFLLAPLLYLYVQSLLVESFRLKRIHVLHLIPFLVMAAYSLLMVIVRSGEKNPGEWKGIVHLESTISYILLDVLIIYYLIRIFITFFQYRREIRNHFAEVRHISLNWLFFILMAFMLMWMTDLTSTVISWLGMGNRELFRLLALISIMINFVFATILVYRSMDQSWEQTGIIEATKYVGSALSDKESAGYAQKIRALMEQDKLFLDPEISLKELSEKSGISPRYLSQVINSKFNQNFFDFINQYRIEEAKRLMAGTVRKELTILEVMYNVGFNSKSSFQTAFRKYTGTTPTEFRHRTLN